MTDDSVLDSDGDNGFQHFDTSWSLVERARGGDEVAWRDLIAWINPLLLHWCRKAGLQEADSFDICQEVAQAVSCNLTSYRQTETSFRGWLKVITANKINDHFRKRRREPEGAGGSDALMQVQNWVAYSLPDDADSRTEEQGILYRRALELLRQQFAENTWRAFWEVVIVGRSPAHVAAELTMTTNAVYLARSRILGRLRREFCANEPQSAAGLTDACSSDPSP